MKPFRSLFDPILYTNFFFFGNAVLYLVKDYWVCGILMLITSIFSLLYHHSFERNKALHVLDVFFAVCTLLTTFVYVISYVSVAQLALLVCILIFALCVKHIATTLDYTYHVYWHILVFFGQFLIFYFLP